MQLFTNETKELSPSAFWVKFKNRKVFLPVPTDDTGFNADMDQINNIYHIVSTRIEDNQLNWSSGKTIAIRDGDNMPQDTDCSYHIIEKTIKVFGFENDGITITKNGKIIAVTK